MAKDSDRYAKIYLEVSSSYKIKALQQAKALIAPISWEEPFGLMFIEALASGTPVISYARGAAMEIIDDGKTGFLINQRPNLKRGNFKIKSYGVKGLAEAIKMIDNMSFDEYKMMCNAGIEKVKKYFDADQMVKNYSDVYKNLAG